MVNPQVSDDRITSREAFPLPFFPARSYTDYTELGAAFFSWLEQDWQGPVVPQVPPGIDRVTSVMRLKPLEAQALYTKKDLCQHWHQPPFRITRLLLHYHIAPVAVLPRQSDGGPGCYQYQGQDLAPLFVALTQLWLFDNIDQQSARFCMAPCGHCHDCREHMQSYTCRVFECQQNSIIGFARITLKACLVAIRDAGTVGAWWAAKGQQFLTQGYQMKRSAAGKIVAFLLDRHYLALTLDEFVDLTRIKYVWYETFTARWAARQPEEFAIFQRGLAQKLTSSDGYQRTFAALVHGILLRHGLSSLTELARPLTPDEVAYAVQHKLLLTMPLIYGLEMPTPMATDLRLGHLLLDEVRRYLWAYGATQAQLKGSHHWMATPFRWGYRHIARIEHILSMDIWGNGDRLLPPRPEVLAARHNPYMLAADAAAEGNGIAQLPDFAQELIAAYIHCRQAEPDIAYRTFGRDVGYLVSFFTWAHRTGILNTYHTWDLAQCRAIYTTFDHDCCSHLELSSRYAKLGQTANILRQLAQYGLTYPPGGHIFKTLVPPEPQHERWVPAESLLDRVFMEGVRQLSHDPLSRLALTIQYYCGTRVEETRDMHLFSVLEDEQGHILLTIPRGKTKTERCFPLVPVGMEPLLTYMDEVVALQMGPGGLPRIRRRSNYRYLETHPVDGNAWYYLFDQEVAYGDRHRNAQILPAWRVQGALQDAILMAAYTNPDGLFQEKTYDPACSMRRRVGQTCAYFALRDGVTTCPICGSALTGTRGQRCRRKLAHPVTCDGQGKAGDRFCAKCATPLAKLVHLTPHLFRHNSVSRAYRLGMPLAHNMRIHGHTTIPMHLRYVHVTAAEEYEAVRQVMMEMRARESALLAQFTPGQVIVDGQGITLSLEAFFDLTLRRALQRRTLGVWGGFVASTLTREGIASPLRDAQEMLLTEETYGFAVAQYRYDALGLAISEVALQRHTAGKHHAVVPAYLNRAMIDRMVEHYMRDRDQLAMPTDLAKRLMRTEVQRQQEHLHRLEMMLEPWWRIHGSLEQLIRALTPTGVDAFYQGAVDDVS